MDIATIRRTLGELSILSNKAFNEKLISTHYPVLGCTIPSLRNYAKSLTKQGDDAPLFRATPQSHEEILLRGFCIGLHKTDNETVLSEVDDYIPLIDNWATCDCFMPSLKRWKKNPEELFDRYESFTHVGTEFERRFLVVMAMSYGLIDDYVDRTLALFQSVRNGEYYVDMAIAWGLATALAKYYDKTFPIIAKQRLPKSIQDKTIQKAVDSFRITMQQKTELRKYRQY